MLCTKDENFMNMFQGKVVSLNFQQAVKTKDK